MNLQDYLNAPDDAERFEVINGGMVFVAPPSVRHASVMQELNYKLCEVVIAQRLGMVFAAPTIVRLGHHDIATPDLFFVSNAERDLMKEMYFDGPPDLVIEVQTPTSLRHDLVTKTSIYQRCGVLEYWIADPQKETIRVFVLTDGRFIEQSNAEGRAVSAVIPDVEIDVSSVFAGTRPAN